MNKGELLSVVKTWISLDDEIKGFQKLAREKKKEKKEATKLLIETMRENEIDCFDLGKGNKLIYSKRKGKKALSKKHLLDSLSKYFQGNNQQANELSKFIMDSREDSIKEDLRRKIPKIKRN